MVVTYDLASAGGGVKQHALDLAEALRGFGDQVTVIGPASAPIDDPRIHTFGGVVNVPANGSDNMLGILVSPLAVRRFFREHTFDVIHIHEPLQPSLAYWTVWFTRHLPHVATFHAFAEAESTALAVARRAWGTTVFPWYQRAIAVSPAAHTYASSAWQRPLAVIPNGVSTSLFSDSPVLRVDRRVRLLFVGRLGDPRKGGTILFEAYRKLIESGRDVVLDVIGELGNAPPPPDLPGLTFHGAVDRARLIEMYGACDVFVAPSTGQESFGIVLLEAMASSKPVVCSDIEGYRRVAGPGTQLVPPRDSEALARAIEHTLAIGRRERQKLGALNRHHVEQFDWHAIVERVRGEYLCALDAMASRS
ncbi:MAG: Phosphatidylinositol alpha-mannosyltransferase [Myxococcales bacterium]|nr:Phosphatidylinositol alpha-mannosyltransferase [Myxococcales bacterium]